MYSLKCQFVKFAQCCECNTGLVGICSLAAESSDETNLHAQLHGAANLPGNLVKYSRLHWDDPIDVSFIIRFSAGQP